MVVFFFPASRVLHLYVQLVGLFPTFLLLGLAVTRYIFSVKRDIWLCFISSPAGNVLSLFFDGAYVVY